VFSKKQYTTIINVLEKGGLKLTDNVYETLPFIYHLIQEILDIPVTGHGGL
jgi:hypothetical protein